MQEPKTPREFPCMDDAPINTGNNQVDYNPPSKVVPMFDDEDEYLFIEDDYEFLENDCEEF